MQASSGYLLVNPGNGDPDRNRMRERHMPTSGTTVLRPVAVAERWDVTTAHITNLVRCGKLPAMRIGRSLRIRLSDVEAFEKAHTVGSSASAA